MQARPPRNGLRYGVVEDFAIPHEAAAHPYLYGHNVSIGVRSLTAPEMLSARPCWAKQLPTIPVLEAGLVYVDRATAHPSERWLAGLATLLSSVTDGVQKLPFGPNPLRGVYWLALFGSLLYVTRLARARWPGPPRLSAAPS